MPWLQRKIRAIFDFEFNIFKIEVNVLGICENIHIKIHAKSVQDSKRDPLQGFYLAILM